MKAPPERAEEEQEITFEKAPANIQTGWIHKNVFNFE